ncbi:T6SS immunity protein Tdi1 domain-containing protein [Tepidibacter sp. Z1-5]|uniref:T6SS immunity protein Tdi1 domain-containing protein n=1 Tax=Tepidibacter sp. Z1-5 TaxID=3134138 RepID=UPI0030BAE217
MPDKIFDDFILEEKTSQDIIERYTDRVPEQMLQVWKQYGFGSILNGYLKIVNPDEFQSLLKDVYVRYENSVALFTTSMGDIIVWEDNRYVGLLNFRRGKITCISAGFKFFFRNLEEEAFKNKALDWLPYSEAITRYGVPKIDECFGYVPILGLGGSEKIENLDKVKLVEHIYLITQFMGPIE